MTAATMLKRINTMRKEIAKYEKEIKSYRKQAKEAPHEAAKAYCEKWVDYYLRMVAKKEEQIAEASRKAAEIASEEEREAMIDAMAEEMATRGFKNKGYTTSGKPYIIEGNCGWTDRSLHCWTMYIDGETAFTSGTLNTVARYILTK